LKKVQFFLLLSALIDDKNFLQGFELLKSQVFAMTLKKFVYSLRSYKLFIIQFIIPALFVIITMLIEHKFGGGKQLPALPITLDEYLSPVTLVEIGNATNSFVEALGGYEKFFQSSLKGYLVIRTDFESYILNKSVSSVNLKNMIGASLDENHIVAWFNNQGFHTAPLTVNIINNAILKISTRNPYKFINVINKPLPFLLGSRVSRKDFHQLESHLNQ
jgi:ATP-binding cassette, subfamily A (ABC1), member 3